MCCAKLVGDCAFFWTCIHTNMALNTENSPHLLEYLSLIGDPQPESLAEPIGPDDALLIIDMQHDFLLKDAVTNPDGGRFGSPEGDQCVEPIVKLIELFAERGGHVIATRDYHPHDHASFTTCGGPYPPHCVQGTKGSELVPEIAAALAAAMRTAGNERIGVCFKAMHEKVDSFGALPYAKASEHVAPRNAGEAGLVEAGLPKRCAAVGCCSAPWTGSIFLKQSAISGPLSAADASPFGELDANAPPDLLALLDDGVERRVTNLQQALEGRKRIFVCGLCLDVCCLDTCVNAAEFGFRSATFMILDACRAAHICGVGAFGSGFLYDPERAKGKMDDVGLRFASVSGLLGAPSSAAGFRRLSLHSKDGPAFPHALQPFGLETAPLPLKLDMSSGRYTIAIPPGARSEAVAKCFTGSGVCSPLAPLPAGWPGAPHTASQLAWANPLVKKAGATPGDLSLFLSATAEADLRFIAYGGFVLTDRSGAVVAVQAIGPAGGADDVVHFGEPRTWRNEKGFTAALAPRFTRVTVPALLRAGALDFCWVGPGEGLRAEPELWVPSTTGAFVYKLDGKPSVYFPVKLGGGGSRSHVKHRWLAFAGIVTACVSAVAAVATKRARS